MSDINLVIRMTKESQPRLGFRVGCLLLLAFASAAESVNAQTVQVASENPGAILGASAQLVAGESGRFSSRRVLVQFPQKGDASPSDLSKDRDDKVDEKSSSAKGDDEKSEDKKLEDKKTDKEEESDKKDGDAKKDDGKGITPVQSAGLKLSVDRVNISTKTIGTGILPEDTAAKRAAPSTSLLDGQSRGIVSQQVNWRPASICHLPLYFEDAMLERHGHVRWGCAQPIVSGAKFLTTIPLLPYITTLQPPCEPRYTLGHFRPGSCAPTLKDHLPWDRRAATVEVVSLGAFFWAAPL
jgi:hypothetical protein